MVFSKRSEGPVRDIVLGVAGALIGGWVFRAFASPGMRGLDYWNILVAFAGAVVVLFAWYVIQARRPIELT
jgi:uncharacterized membrane protein YeaQ/YmgE (transglycosylase-associated protein family)